MNIPSAASAQVAARAAGSRDGRAAEQRDELAASIIQSPRRRAGIEVGRVMPSALAVWRLTITLNLVERSTGRSPGFAPLRILSMKAAAR